MLRRHLAAVLLVPLGLGCSPYLRRDVRDVTAYRASERCAQGPLEIAVPLEGARWAEGIEVTAYTPRAISGRFEVTMGDRTTHGRFGPQRQIPQRVPNGAGDMTTEWVTPPDQPTAPENDYCLADAGASGTVEGAVAHTVVRVGPAPNPEPAAPPPVQDGKAPTLVAAVDEPPHHWRFNAIRLGLGRLRLFRMLGTYGDAHATEMHVVPPGTIARVRIWSDVVLDLDRVVFVVERWVETPSVSDDEWLAELEKRREEARRRDDERRRRTEARNAHCQAHHEDEDCWGPGGLPGYRRRLEESQRRWQAERAAGEARPRPAPPAQPDGPPPPPRADARPPAPSENATWVSGHWRWLSARWIWSPGFWRVPEADMRDHRTVAAPSAPPEPRTEPIPPAPDGAMVWTPGYWTWNAVALEWTWVAGCWRLPPEPGASWQRPSWRIEVRGSVFVPGGWRLRVGR